MSHQNNGLAITAIILSSVAIVICLIAIGFSVFTYFRLPHTTKDYFSAHKEELRGPAGPTGPQGTSGINGVNGRNGSDGANGSNSSSPSYCSTYNSGYGYGSVNCF